MTDLHKAVLANLDALSDDAAAHIFPSDLQKCMTSECVVQVVSVRAGNPDERTVPLFSREQVEAALREAATAPSVRSIGWVAPKDTYAFPVLFNPYTGQPRDARDIQSDPQGSLLVPPGASAIAALAPGQPVQAAPKVWAYSTEDGERIVPAKTHEDAMRDGGAMASGMRPYTAPLTALREALAAPVVPASFTDEDMKASWLTGFKEAEFQFRGGTEKSGEFPAKTPLSVAPQAAPPKQPSVPPGYALVPIEPTPEMCQSAQKAGFFQSHVPIIWKALLSAAPQPKDKP